MRNAETVLASGTAAVFAVLMLVHVYWALGGRRGWALAIPERDGALAFRPGRALTLLIATLLALAGALVALRGGLWCLPGLPGWLATVGTAGVTVVLSARAAGDFHWFGLWRRVRHTRFARLDRALYTPLCVLLAVACALVCISGRPCAP